MDNVNRSKSNPLAGVTAFVDVRAEHDNRSKAISNELERLGATIADRLTKNVTHVVFKDGRSSTVTQMQKLGSCHFVSVLWVDSCKTTQSHVTEMLFPAKLPQNFDSPLPSRVRVKSLQPKTFEQDLNKSAKKEHKKRSRLKRINKEVETPDQIICFDSQEYMKSSDLYKLVKTPQMVPETPYVFSYITGDFDQTADTLDDLNVSFEKRGTLHGDDHEFIRGTPMCPTKQILQNKRYKTDRRRKSRLSEKSTRKSVHFSQTDKQSITSYTITSPTKRGSSEASGGDKSLEKLIKIDKTILANFNVSDEIDSTPPSVKHIVAKSPDKHQSDNDFSVNKCRFPTLPGTSCEENPLVSSWKALNACLLSSGNEEELDKENLIPQKTHIKSTKIKNDITKCGKVIIHDKGKEMNTDKNTLIDNSNKQNPSAKSKDSIVKPVTQRSSEVNFKIIKKLCSHSPTAEDPYLCSTPLSNESSQENLNSSFVHDETEGLVLALQIQECDLDLANDDISNLMRQGNDDVDRTKETSDSSAHNNNTIETQPLDSRWVIRNEQRERSLAKPLFNSEDTQDDTFEKENGSNKEIQQINSEEEDTCNEHTQHDNLIEQNNFNEETQRENSPKNSSNKETKHNRSAEKHPSIEATLHCNPTEETSSNAEQPGIPPEEPDVVGDSGISESEETAEPSFQESRTEHTIEESRTEPTIEESRTEPTIQESRNRCTAPSRTRIKSTKKSKVSFVATSLHFGEQEFVKAAVKSLGGFLLRTCVQPNTTHVVAGSARRTLNILYAIVKGCWILTPKWVSDSYEKGKWLKEDGYEMSEEFPAAKLSRTHFEKHGKSSHANLLSKVKPIYLADETKPPHDELVNLILACGGKITTSMRKAGFSIGLSCCRRKEFPSIAEKWLLDSIMRGTVLPTSAYQIQVQPGSRSPAF